ncbi:MAG: response regulator [Terriglobales bacterium]
MAVALVVDDSMLIRHTVCRYFEDRGWRVETAVDGHEAMEVLSRLRPDLIVTDMQMPTMTGTEFITQVKNISEMANIPIIILCGRNSEREAKANESRANCAIYKDIDILAQLDRALITAMAAARA